MDMCKSVMLVCTLSVYITATDCNANNTTLHLHADGHGPSMRTLGLAADTRARPILGPCS